jgi:hypothetical protein
MTSDWQRAADTGDVAALARLAAAGTDLDSRDAHGQTALMRAALAGHAEAVRWLAAQGADLNHSAKFHLTALMLAVVNGKYDAARVLIEAGADLTARGSGAPGFAGKTAADLARARGERDVAAWLEHAMARQGGGRPE